MTDNATFEQGIKVAQTFDVSTKENSVVVYSISYQKTTQNRDNAIDFIKKNQPCFFTRLIFTYNLFTLFTRAKQHSSQ